VREFVCVSVYVSGFSKNQIDPRPEPQTQGQDISAAGHGFRRDDCSLPSDFLAMGEECLLFDDDEEEEAGSEASLRRLLQAKEVEQGFA
jgi:hypothetical protein